MALADIQKRSTWTSNGKPGSTGLEATLREIEPGTRIRLLMRDGSEIAGPLAGVTGSAIEFGGGRRRVALRDVKRLYLAYGETRRAA